MKKQLSALATVTLLALTGCGGDDSLSAAGGSVATSAQALAAFNGSINNELSRILISTNAPTLRQGNAGAALFSDIGIYGIYDACTTVNPASRVDVDGDGIAKEKTYTYNCNNIVDSGSTYNLVGTESVVDLDDTKANVKGGYRYNHDFVFSYAQATGSNYNLHRGFTEVVPSATSLTYAMEYEGVTNDTRTGMKADVTTRTNWRSVYTPVDMANPTASGTVVVSGFYSLVGTSENQANWGDMNVAFEVSSSGLTYDAGAGCNKSFQSGSLTFTDGSGNRLVFDYACTSGTVKYNGTFVANL